jgi:hypothetical protein
MPAFWDDILACIFRVKLSLPIYATVCVKKTNLIIVHLSTLYAGIQHGGKDVALFYYGAKRACFR